MKSPEVSFRWVIPYRPRDGLVDALDRCYTHRAMRRARCRTRARILIGTSDRLRVSRWKRLHVALNVLLLLWAATGDAMRRPANVVAPPTFAQSNRPHYVPTHLIVGFRPGVRLPAEATVAAEEQPEEIFQDLVRTAGLREIERLVPALPLPRDRQRASEALTRRAPRSLSEAALLLQRHGLDRMAVLRFARPIEIGRAHV